MLARLGQVLCGVAILSGCVDAHAAVDDFYSPLITLTRDMPDDIKDFTIRRADCNHWWGEPYEGVPQGRKDQIEAALKGLRCDSIPSDEAVLKRRYANNPPILDALEASKYFSPG